MAVINFRRPWGRIGRLSLGRLVLLVSVCLCVSSLLIFSALPKSKWEYAPVGLLDDIWPETRRMPVATPPMPLLKRVACVGPRGRLLSESPDDELRPVKLDTRKSASIRSEYH
jgi:hypothetical protein